MVYVSKEVPYATLKLPIATNRFSVLLIVSECMS